MKGPRMGHLRRVQARRGTAIVEMAIVLPILVLLLLGIVEFAHLFYVRHLMLNAATQGARLGLLPGVNEEQILARVEEVLTQSGIGELPVTTDAAMVVIPPDPPDVVGTTTITVKVRTTYADASIFGGFLPDSLEMVTPCTMVK